MKQINTQIKTTDPQRIMKRLSKHWAHKLDVVLEDNRSTITLPMGECLLICHEQILEVQLTANTDEDLTTLKNVVADHLERMAKPEELNIQFN